MSEPTKALRVEVVDNDRDSFCLQGPWGNNTQAEIDAAYINWLIETDERRREQAAKKAASPGDLIVDLGNLERTERKFTALLQHLDTVQNEAYESMVEDFIQTFNNVVLQGIDPLMAVYAMSQGFAIVLGFALRANLPFSIAQTILSQQMRSATSSEQMVRVITSPAGRG